MSSHWISSVRVYESKMRMVQASLGQQPARFSECSLEWHAYLHVMTCVCSVSHVSPQASKFYKYQTAKHRNPSWLMLAREFHTFPNYVHHFSPSFTIFHHLSPKMFTHLPRLCQGQGLTSGGAPRDGDDEGAMRPWLIHRWISLLHVYGMFIQSQHDSSIFLICGHHRKIVFPVFPLKYWEIQVSLMGKTGYKMVQVWMGTGNWGIFHWNDAWKGPDPFGDFPSLDMDHNICPLFKGIFKSLFIEFLGGLLGVCRQKSRYQWTQVKQRGLQDFLAWWLSFSIDILSIMIPRFWNRHGCHTTNSFVGPKAIKHQQTFFDVLGEPLGYPVGTFGKHPQKFFDRYLRCFFGLLHIPELYIALFINVVWLYFIFLI